MATIHLTVVTSTLTITGVARKIKKKMKKSIAPTPKTNVPKSSNSRIINSKILNSRNANDFVEILKEFNCSKKT